MTDCAVVLNMKSNIALYADTEQELVSTQGRHVFSYSKSIATTAATKVVGRSLMQAMQWKAFHFSSFIDMREQDAEFQHVCSRGRRLIGSPPETADSSLLQTNI